MFVSYLIENSEDRFLAPGLICYRFLCQADCGSVTSPTEHVFLEKDALDLRNNSLSWKKLESKCQTVNVEREKEREGFQNDRKALTKART